MATNFEAMLAMNRHIKQIQHANGDLPEYDYESQKRDFRLEDEYRKIDILTAELEKELAEVRRLKAEMQNYKMQFNLEVRDNATKEINKVLDNAFKSTGKGINIKL